MRDFLLLVSFFGLVIGMIGAIRGSIPRFRFTNRVTGVFVLCLSIVLMVAVGSPPPAPLQHEQEEMAGLPHQPMVHESPSDPTELASAAEQQASWGASDDTDTKEPHRWSETTTTTETPNGLANISVHFIDVGQGDAILIEAGNVTLLIDGGPRSAGQTVVDYLVRRGIRELDVVIGTHPHEDHIGGLIQVFREFPVRRIIDSGQPHTTQTFDHYLTEIERQVEGGDCTYEIPEGQTIELAENAHLSILGPDRNLGTLNNNSVIARLHFDAVSFLFTGDAERESEQRMLARGIDLSAQVLKVAHHGSRSSTTSDFLAAVSPTYAVIQVGVENRYGHPTETVLQRLQEAGVQIFRTDQQGTIVFSTDGRSIEVDREPWEEGEDSILRDPLSSPSADNPAPGIFIGSRRSDKYHDPSCRHAATIHAANEIWFASHLEAEAHGYVPCAFCQ